MAEKVYYLALYNPETKVVIYEKSVPESAMVKSEVSDYPDNTALLWEYDKRRYETEATGRGNPWRSYCENVPFSWDVVTPKKEAEK